MVESHIKGYLWDTVRAGSIWTLLQYMPYVCKASAI